MIKKNDVFTLEVTDLTNLGFGVAKIDGMVVFISGAVAGDTVKAKIIKVTKSYAVARLEEVVSPSSARCDGRCPVSACKSCAYKEISYTEECKLKEKTVAGAFLHEGLDHVKVLPLVGSPATTGYRNKAQYPIAKTADGSYVIGFFAPKSHRVTEARNCPLAPTVFGEINEALAQFFKKYSLSVYDEESGEGLLRHIYLRRGEISGEILLTLVINGSSFPNSEELVKIITESFPSVVGILLNFNTENTNIILGKSYKTLFGRDYIYDTLCDVTLKLTAPAFYQVNHDAAELLYNEARRLARLKKSDTLLDIYCGVGSIGLSMAEDCSRLVGIEIVDSAVVCARENAEKNSVRNAFFFTGDAAGAEGLLCNAKKELGDGFSPDVIVLDPPRSGCDKRLIEFVSSLSPKRIVYISCNPSTLARDVKLFDSLEYTTESVTPFDLFPGTGHVESVVCLERRLDNELRQRMN